MVPEKKVKPVDQNLTCGCIIPTGLVLLGILVGSFIGFQMNKMQLLSCGVPSEFFVNKAACIEAVQAMKTMYILGGAAFGAFAGFILGIMVFFLSNMGKSKTTTLPSDAPAEEQATDAPPEVFVTTSETGIQPVDQIRIN